MDNKVIVSKAIGNRIKTLLAEQDKKQKELAGYLEVQDNTVSYFCSGARTPNTFQIIKIANFFGVSADYLLGITKEKPPVTLADKLQTILDHYGSEAQLEILIEECAELIQAVQKLRRYSYSTDSADYYERFKEEVADVAVMVEQMMIAVGEDEIRAIMEKKVERQLRRIGEENG